MDFTANQNKKQQLQEKEKQLAAVMDEYGKEPVCLAFSGGVDSSLLLKLACAAGTGRRYGPLPLTLCCILSATWKTPERWLRRWTPTTLSSQSTSWSRRN